MRTVDRIATGDVHAHPVRDRLDPLDSCRRAEVKALGGQEASDLGGDVGVLPCRDPLAALDDGDGAAEAGEELSQLQADVAATEDHEVGRELVEMEHAVVVEPRDVIEAGDRWLRGAGADVEEHVGGGQQAISDGDCELGIRAAGESSLAVQQRQPFGVGKGLGLPVDPAVDERVLARHDGGEVDGHVASAHAVSPSGPRQVGHPGRRPQRLGRPAATIQARTAHLVGFDQGDLAAGSHEVMGDAGAGLTGSDHDGVERESVGHVHIVALGPPEPDHTVMLRRMSGFTN